MPNSSGWRERGWKIKSSGHHRHRPLINYKHPLNPPLFLLGVRSTAHISRWANLLIYQFRVQQVYSKGMLVCFSCVLKDIKRLEVCLLCSSSGWGLLPLHGSACIFHILPPASFHILPSGLASLPMLARPAASLTTHWLGLQPSIYIFYKNDHFSSIGVLGLVVLLQVLSSSWWRCSL